MGKQSFPGSADPKQRVLLNVNFLKKCLQDTFC